MQAGKSQVPWCPGAAWANTLRIIHVADLVVSGALPAVSVDC